MRTQNLQIPNRTSAIARGFTMMELLIAIAVVAILATLAVPSFSDLLARNRGAGQVNGLIAGINAARAEAVKRSENVLFCTSADKTSCGGTAASPWIVALEDNSDGLNPLRVIGAAGLVDSTSDLLVEFDQVGRLFPPGTTAKTIELSDSKREWTIDVSLSGGATASCKLSAGSGTC